MSVPNPNGRSAAAQRGSNPHWLAATAGAVAMLAAALPALAQNQVGGNGHLSDANNGVGSDGYNPASNPNSRATSGTQVLTDHSTGLSGFHSNSQVDDPNVFQGGNPNADFDRFATIAAPVNYAGPSNGSPGYTSYYAKQTYTAPPPPNFTTTANGAGYVPAPAAPQRGNAGGPGTVGQVGMVNGPAANQPLYAMSPLYGVREVQAAGADDGNTVSTIASPLPGIQPSSPSVAVPVGSQRREAPVAADQPSDLLGALRQRFLAAAGGAGVGGTNEAPAGGDITTFGTPAPTPSTKPSDLAARAGADQPFVITSLTLGIRSTGLADLLRSAEAQMRLGQFGQAVDTYNSAAEMAPNNPFVPLGRGFAELGTGYYGQAETDLTCAILAEPAVLAAQYDLKGFLGQDRLKFVQKDLADIGTTEQTARPYLLLAYIDHNTGADDATVTAKDLDTAEARGANKQVVNLMRAAWNLKPAKMN